MESSSVLKGRVGIGVEAEANIPAPWSPPMARWMGRAPDMTEEKMESRSGQATWRYLARLVAFLSEDSLARRLAWATLPAQIPVAC